MIIPPAFANYSSSTKEAGTGGPSHVHIFKYTHQNTREEELDQDGPENFLLHLYQVPFIPLELVWCLSFHAKCSVCKEDVF